MAKYHNQQPNMANLMKQAQKMQQEMQKAQEELLSREYEATSGGGAVKVVYGGDKKLRAIEIDDELLNPDDKDMLTDMIIVAVNEVIEKAEADAQTRIGSVTGGIGFPGL
ncbi:MAG: YbaB/EbfC family nucleoid-associated protein [Eubacteriaceae bacterium]|nr:YbaB/EbfC family nucleoid-associated protein [Eubacteriaceae bacterium]MBQ1465943.1 YbaB/EbfC family nucleoid-associated protein [Eubacteriaceae bacterium]MCR4894910.1 YbaB/EbfC family nucleoid-associated protein [Eubacteriales bacterium]